MMRVPTFSARALNLEIAERAEARRTAGYLPDSASLYRRDGSVSRTACTRARMRYSAAGCAP
jgi:hypothetical protein